MQMLLMSWSFVPPPDDELSLGRAHTHTQLISEFAKESSPTPKTVVHMMQARGLDIQSNGSLGRIVASVVVLITA